MDAGGDGFFLTVWEDRRGRLRRSSLPPPFHPFVQFLAVAGEAHPLHP